MFLKVNGNWGGAGEGSLGAVPSCQMQYQHKRERDTRGGAAYARRVRLRP